MLPSRKKNRLDGYDYRENGGYFVTICTEKRKPLFWEDPEEKVAPSDSPKLSPIGKIVEHGLIQMERCYPSVTLDKYKIMPDHIHFVLILENKGGCGSPSLSRIVQQFKGSVRKQAGFPIWQKSFYEHVIRNDQDYSQIWEYIEENPMALYMDKY